MTDLDPMTDDLSAAKAWLTQLARCKPGHTPDYTGAPDYACTLLRVLEEPRLPDRPAIEWLQRVARVPDSPAAVYAACALAMLSPDADFRSYLSAPPKQTTKEIDVWRVEYAGRECDGWYPGEAGPFLSIDRAEESAAYWRKSPEDYACIRITGPHKRTVPV